MSEHFIDPLGRTIFESQRPDGSVDLEVAPGQKVCDFCLDPNPTWEYECGVVAIVGNPNIHASDDEWAACTTCRDLIEAGSIPGLVRRMVDGQTARVREADIMDLPPRRVQVQNARTNVLAFLRAKRGGPRPWSG
jgi:hypothetical protein